MINSNIHFQFKTWEEERCPVGRCILTPTETETTNKVNSSKKKHYNLTWKQGRSPVGGDCYHTTYLNCKTDFFFMLIVGAMAIAPYGFFDIKSLLARLLFMPISINGALKTAPYSFFLNLKHYNLTYLSQKLFFNVKILKNKKNSI